LHFREFFVGFNRGFWRECDQLIGRAREYDVIERHYGLYRV
jgi:hypothetical protein